jgi:Ala-tRNA(Pro) deacylase
MMKTCEYLQQRRVPFEVVTHPEAFDAVRLAEAVHTPGREVAKTVLLRVDRGFQYVVAVLPSTHQIDFVALGRDLGGAKLELATEAEISECCPDCEVGVLPPFGSQYAAETIVDASLADDDEIVFEGSTHSEAIRMTYQDYYDIEHPRVAHFARRG